MNKKGFTLIELLIVVAIIGVIAAIAIPNLLVALQKGKQKATMGDIKNIAVGVEAYVSDNACTPVAGDIVALSTNAQLVPFHIKMVPTRDGWGTQYVFANRFDGEVDSYRLTSLGRNKAVGGAPDNPWLLTEIIDFNPDLIYENGAFTQMPAKK